MFSTNELKRALGAIFGHFRVHAAAVGGWMLFFIFVRSYPAYRDLAVPEHMASHIIPTVAGWMVGAYLLAYGLLWAADSYRRDIRVTGMILVGIGVGWFLQSPVLMGWALIVVYLWDYIGQKIDLKKDK